MNPTWHLLTGEYPDQPGGVSDYTRLVARGLAAAGEDVQVWAPAFRGPTPNDDGVTVHRLPDLFGLRSLRILAAALNTWPRPSRLLVQYVPHAFGFKAMNVPFARWLRRRRQPVWVMFHEVAFAWEHGQSLKHQVLGGVTTYMAAWIAGAAERIFVSIPAWKCRLPRSAAVRERISWLPVPSNLPARAAPIDAGRQRERLGVPVQAPLVGHFGTYDESITRVLTPLLQELLRRQPACHCLLLGRHSDSYATRFRDQAGRIHATGGLPAETISECLSACDVLLQPFPDGISCRRGSAMAALALGRPVVTTFGALTEPFWKESGALALGPAECLDELIPLVEGLLGDEVRRAELSRRSQRLYVERFSLERTINVLLGNEAATPFPAECS